MKYNFSIKVIVTFVLMVGILFPYTSVSTEAATSISLVTASKLNVREKSSLSSKKVGFLKQGSKITVYSKTKSGWSEIRFKKKKAYVSSKYLQASYYWNKSKVYSYKDRKGNLYKYTYKRKNLGWDIWEETGGGNKFEVVMKEDIKGIHAVYGGAYSENVTDLKYPIKTGQYWDNWVEANVYTLIITSKNKTVKTPAGTFKNVVAVKDGSYTAYYAPNIGYVLGTENGEVLNQLIKISNK